MTEKEFRRLVTDVEILADERDALNEKLLQIRTIIEKNVTAHTHIQEIKKAGSWAKGTLLNDAEELDIMVIVEPTGETPFALENEAICNEIVNAFIYAKEVQKLSDITRNVSRNSITIRWRNYIIHLLIRYTQEAYLAATDELQIQFTELANRDYTYFRNAVKIIQYYKEEQHIHISGYIIEIILYYALNTYFKDNRYEDYLHAFIKALDELMKGKKIEVSKDIYQKLGVDPNNQVKKNYMVLDVANPNNNLVEYVNEISIGEYRKLKRVLSKLVDTKVDLSMGTNATVVLSIQPIAIKDSDTFAWKYSIENSDYSNSGGSYANTPQELLTAMYKALYKGLRAIVDHQLNRKNIEVRCSKHNILKLTELSEENRSRIKTIETYIENNGLVVTFQ